MHDFNPRSLTGATMVTASLLMLLLFQSTLPYGSDPFLMFHVNIERNFNPRSLTGATVICSVMVLLSMRFQSTLPYGSDRWLQFIPFSHADFNPRSLTGATFVCTTAPGEPLISIHAPLRERHQHYRLKKH